MGRTQQSGSQTFLYLIKNVLSGLGFWSGYSSKNNFKWLRHKFLFLNENIGWEVGSVFKGKKKEKLLGVEKKIEPILYALECACIDILNTYHKKELCFFSHKELAKQEEAGKHSQ